MKFLTLATLLLVPTVWAAAAPPQCKVLGKSNLLDTQGERGNVEYLGISDESAGKNAHYLQNDGKIRREDAHQRFDLALCHLHHSGSDLPQTYFRIHPSNDTSLCLTMGGPGPAKGEEKTRMDGFKKANLLLVKPCEHHTSPKFPLQIFEDSRMGYGDGTYTVRTIKTDKEESREIAIFSEDKVYLMTTTPDMSKMPWGPENLYIE